MFVWHFLSACAIIWKSIIFPACLIHSRLTVKANLYGETIVRIPAPEFIIFYNGKDEMPERQLLKLSDMYSVKEEKPKLELEATLLNISGTNNRS